MGSCASIAGISTPKVAPHPKQENYTSVLEAEPPPGEEEIAFGLLAGVADEPENEPVDESMAIAAAEARELAALRRDSARHQRVAAAASPVVQEDVKSTPSWTRPVMSAENRRFLIRVLQRHFLFGSLEDHERDLVIHNISCQNASKGSVIFSQGEKGDCWYIIQAGTFEVVVGNEPVRLLRSKHTFGELAMLYKVDRTATVRCKTSGVLWHMDGDSFRTCMEQLRAKTVQKAQKFFDSDPNFSLMSQDERNTLAAACSIQNFHQGEQILREGEVGEWMFIVLDGTVQIVDPYGNTFAKRTGSIIGGLGLISSQQFASAVAVDKVTCVALGTKSLERLLGPGESVLRRSVIKALITEHAERAKKDGREEEGGFYFKELSKKEQAAVIDRFEDAAFTKGNPLITAAANAQLIVVTEGEAAVLPNNKDYKDDFEAMRRDALQILKPGHSYGFKEMLHNSAMPHKVVPLTNVNVYRVTHKMIEQVLGWDIQSAVRHNEIRRVLTDIFIFRSLAKEQLAGVIQSLAKIDYAAGEVIVQQGEEAHHFYLIQSGKINVYKDGELLRNLLRWDYFGERALLLEEKRSATCKAAEATTCLRLQKDVFEGIVGSFKEELEHRMMLQDLNIELHDLICRAVVGRGAFGQVKLVNHRSDTNRIYALKSVCKLLVIQQQQQKSIANEREINAECYHPCIMHFIRTFQDMRNVYFLTEFLGGGDLFTVIREIGNLTKTQAQFFGGSIVLALEYLHGRSIIYRDLKPENLVLDFQGYAKLVDFGCCKKCLRTSTLVGTPEYFAPESIVGKGYGAAVDWWALGVMMHEFVVGPLPFGSDADDQLQLLKDIMEAPLAFPSYIKDDTAINLVSGLLERTPELRLGASARGAKEIKEHPFFSELQWDTLVRQAVQAPWVPDMQKIQESWEVTAECGHPVCPQLPSMSIEIQDPVFERSMEWAKDF
mmetsp:Transcript_40373/g.72498  ORF Transcript_40373/g.72498 Transcript_40373/m.72498 type:complete len:947 (-) Transcript_40373:74-2914(-)|eukprot:CAMPEP_0197628146 /NCGR_PEP_ID=MMETSP1338-20131121/6550_1 /TAXON_ID=43686 ORGANISM="Pelagodinium beii, Strain RCC1491" /NCGR_SAMPLE_ID=MMETSP1338 /ASSEMBLY_ACC=CAM_ASM_000754 /LENGTH=946 /DNA_ID=CAMNT_0043199063 /DNA_START=89 /DNA_END=2929 /DNA_ORIENTATION=+